MQLCLEVIDFGDGLRLQTLSDGLFLLFNSGKLLFELCFQRCEVAYGLDWIAGIGVDRNRYWSTDVRYCTTNGCRHIADYSYCGSASPSTACNRSTASDYTAHINAAWMYATRIDAAWMSAAWVRAACIGTARMCAARERAACIGTACKGAARMCSAGDHTAAGAGVYNNAAGMTYGWYYRAGSLTDYGVCHR